MKAKDASGGRLDTDSIRLEAIEFAGIGLYRYKFDGEIIFMDRGAMRILEIDKKFPAPNALAGKNIEELIVYAGPKGLLRKKIREHGHVRGFEYAFITLGGKEKWALHDSYLVRDPETGEEAIQVIIRDITSQKEAVLALRETEEKFRSLSEEIADGVVVHTSGAIRWVNKAVTEIFGYSQEELIGKSIEEYVTPDEADILNERMSARLKGKYVPADYETIGIRKDGKRIYLEISAKTIEFDRQPAIQFVLRDITDRKQTEEKLRRTALEFQGIFEAFPDLYFKFAADGTILDAKASRISDFYVPPSQFMGRKITEILPPPVGGEAMECIRAALETKQTAAMEYALPMQEAERIFEARFIPAPDDQVIAFIRDISERRYAQEALRESDRFLADVFECIQDGISVLDTELNVLRVNPAMRKWYSHALPLEGKKCFAAYHGAGSPCSVCPSLDAIATGEPRYEIVPKRGADGEITGWLDLYAFPLVSSSTGKITGVIEYVRDITARREAEQELEKHQEHLEELVEERTKELQEIQEKLLASERLAVLGQFAGGISHEIRNPLNVIATTAYYLKKKLGGTDEKILRHLDQIKKQVDICNSIIESVLRLTHIQAPQFERAEISEIINSAVDIARMPGNISVETSLPEAPLIIMADAEHMRMAIRNLLVNSVQAMPDGGNIFIRVETIKENDGKYARIIIQDTGAGISGENIGKVFIPLFTTKAKGLGFGLSIVKMIIEKHGGSIEAVSESGKGAEFRINLPVEG